MAVGIFILGFLALALISFLIFFMFLPIIRGAPFVPTKDRAIIAMVSLAQVKPTDIVADLGSGDGRILFEFIKAGAKEAHGFEINPFLVWRSRRQIRRLGLQNRVIIHLKNFWSIDLSQFSCVTVYGLNHIMRPLEEKLSQELMPGARVLLNAFYFPNWGSREAKDGVRLYRK